MMELKEFVSETITQIAQGLMDAKAKNSDKDILIAPHLNKDGLINDDPKYGVKAQVIHFDLNIIISENKTNGKEKGTLSVSLAHIGFSAESGDKNLAENRSSTEQRISFDIPIIWPTNQRQANDDPPSQDLLYDPLAYN